MRRARVAPSPRLDELAVEPVAATTWRDAVPNDRIAHLVKETLRAFQRSLHIRFFDQSVSLGHWVFLRILWEQDGLTQQELSERAGLMVPTTFVALRAMEKAGYIRRAKRPGNKKNVYLHLTPLGWRLKEVLVPLAVETNTIATEGLSAEELLVLRRCLARMLANLMQDESLWLERQGPPRLGRQQGG